MRRATTESLWRVALAALVGMAVAAVAMYSPLLAGVDRALLAAGAPSQAVHRGAETLLVAIDDKSLAKLGRWPWSRAVHAALINKLTNAGSGAIALDVVLAEPDSANPEADAALADAIQRSGRVLLPVPVTDGGSDVVTSLARQWPGARFVHSEVPFDNDGKVRSLFRWMEAGRVSLPSLPLALLNPELAVPGAELNALGPNEGLRWQEVEPMLVAPLVRPDHVHAYSYSDVLDGVVDPALFRGHRVMVGTTAPGLVRPFLISGGDGDAVVTAAVLNAALTNELATTSGIDPASPRLRLATVLLLTLATMIATGLSRWPLSLVWALIGIVGAYLLQGYLLRTHAFWLGTTPAIAGMLGGGIALATHTLLEQRSRARRVATEAQQLASELSDIVVVVDERGRIAHAQSTQPGMLPTLEGARLAQVPLDALLQLQPPLSTLLSQNTPSGQPLPAKLQVPDGGTQQVLVHITPSSAHGPGGRMISIARPQADGSPDVDALTGLASRARLSAELERRTREGHVTSTGLALIALDGFKRVNEALGYADGDRVLQEVAERMRQLSPPPRMLARWSGDQFAALFDTEGGSSEQLEQLAADLHHSVAGRPLETNHLHLSASVAVASVEPGREHLLVQRAERALIDAKRSGGGRWLVARDEHAGWTRETLAMERDLRTALAKRQFFMAYQPVMDVQSGRFVSMEALVRWQHPERGLIPPGAFLDLCEELGLEIALGDMAFELVHADMRELAKVGFKLPVAINVSTRHFERDDFARQLAESPLLRDAGPGMVKIEVTETMALQDPARAGAQVLALANSGIGVALDDFGCGHSSLALLRSLRVQQVKIDRSFVRDAMEDAGAQALVRAIIGMAKALHIAIVAEGVETPKQSEWLRQEGCHLQQGFLFARPTPLADLPALLTRDRAGALLQ